MRIEQVTAHAFGPLVDVTMELAPGLTVIYGFNESAKSSWHAAIYSALVGRRRGRGRPSSEDQRYADLHKPWDRSGWKVSAIVSLDDGRRIDLVQDLDGKVDCRAVDLAVARDVSEEIIHEGSPDASRWLGLDRKSFFATACVSQADLLLEASDAEGLQEHLQRAAATRGVDATAAAALAAIDGFSRENVGLDRSNSTKPLRSAIDSLNRARSFLSRAQVDHEEYLALAEAVDDCRLAVANAQDEVATSEAAETAAGRRVEAVRAAAEAGHTYDAAHRRVIDIGEALDGRRRRLERARELDAHFAGTAPDGMAVQDERYRIAATAVAGWRAVPATQPLVGAAAADLRAQLDRLPSAPDGEIEPALDVRQAVERVEVAIAVADSHEAQRPHELDVPDEPGLKAALAAGPSVVRELAAQLEASSHQPPAGAADLEGARIELSTARDRAQQARRVLDEAEGADHRARAALRDAMTAAAQWMPAAVAIQSRTAVGTWALSGLLTVAGVVLVAVGQVVLGVVLVTAAVVAGVAGAVLRSRVRSAGGGGALRTDVGALADAAEAASKALHDVRGAALDADRASANAEARHEAALRSASRSAAGRDEVVASCRARSLPDDVDQLRRLGALSEQVLEHRRREAVWAEDGGRCAEALTRSEKHARNALEARGHDGDAPLDVLLQAYVSACRERARQAALAERRPLLLQAIADHEAAETASARAARLHEGAHQALVEAARACGLDLTALSDGVEDRDADGDALAEALVLWQQDRDLLVERTEQEQQEWTELNTILGDLTIEDLESSVTNLAQEHEAAVKHEWSARDERERRGALRDEQAVAGGHDPGELSQPDFAERLLKEAQTETRAARERLERATASAGDAEGAMRERARGLLSVPEAEETVTACQTELDRVQRLQRTLVLTREFLSDAQDRVHRDIAPRLASTLGQWLPAVTGDRWIDAMVDPATLAVSVCGASREWRLANNLSVGTAEQIYLLLRVALAQHLVTTDESCPLLLDDVTVQADDERTRQILELLLRVSDECQVILFAQEPVVAEWARARLAEDPRHRMHDLEPVASS